MNGKVFLRWFWLLLLILFLIWFVYQLNSYTVPPLFGGPPNDSPGGPTDPTTLVAPPLNP